MFKKNLFYSIIIPILFFFISFSSASIGITPVNYDIDYQPGITQTFKFQIIGDSNTYYKISSKGDLKEYVRYKPELVKGSEIVEVKVNLPEKIKTPGMHRVFIGAEQQSDGESGFALLGKVSGSISIMVPYPDKFLQMSLNVKDIKRGEKLPLTITIDNLGLDSANMKTSVEFQDMVGNVLDSYSFGNYILGSQSRKEYFYEWDSSQVNGGFYKVVVKIEYDENVLKEEKSFRIGEFFVNITGTSDDIEKNKISKFNINIESFWNDPISKIYADINVLDYPISFSTPPINLNGFDKGTLSGYIDTSGIPEDVESFKANIKVFYEDKFTEKIVIVHFKKKLDFFLIILGLVLVIFLILLFLLWALKRRRKNDKK